MHCRTCVSCLESVFCGLPEFFFTPLFLIHSILFLYLAVVLSLHHNNITDGDNAASAICTDDSKLKLLTVDCGEISCPCCDTCCDSDDCYQDVLWDTLEHSDGSHEDHFQRSEYSFNPHITIEQPGHGKDNTRE